MSHLISCSILERNEFGDCVWAWAYPSISEAQKDYVMKKTPVDDTKLFFYGKMKSLWFYVSERMEGSPQKFPDIANFSIILWARDYCPDKYKKLGSVLGEVYAKSADPTQVLRHFISVMTIGICSIDEDSPMEFGMGGNFRKTDVRGLINMFGLEIIIIYSALLLKKRIVVYHHSLLPLLESLKSFPSLMPHRKFDEIVFPWFELTDESLAALRNRRYFIAGCFDNALLARPDLTDVTVNVPAKEIVISPAAKDGLVMTKIQKDVALSLTQLAESDLPEDEVVQKIREKTTELIDSMKSHTIIRDDGREVLFISRLKDENVGPALETFYTQLATAENILVLEDES